MHEQTRADTSGGPPAGASDVSGWRRSYERLAVRPTESFLVLAAAHAVLGGLRHLADRSALRRAFDGNLNPPLVLAESVVGGATDGEDGRRRAVEAAFDAVEAAFWLRWEELAEPGAGADPGVR